MLKCDKPLIVADSSIDAQIECHKKLVDSYIHAGLIIKYYHFKDYSYVQKVYAVLQYVSTPYVCLNGVDDFRSLSSLRTAVQFLEHNEDYIVVYGYEYGFVYDLSAIEWYNTGSYLNLYTISFDDPFKRVGYFLDNYATTLYGIFRTTTLINLFYYCQLYAPDIRFAENFLTLQVLLLGKLKIIEEVSLFREMAETSEGAASKTYLLGVDFAIKNDKQLLVEGINCFLSDHAIGNQELGSKTACDIVERLFLLFKVRIEGQLNTSFKSKIIKKLPYAIRNIKRYCVAFIIYHREQKKLMYLVQKKSDSLHEFLSIEKCIKQHSIPAFRLGMADLGQYERLM